MKLVWSKTGDELDLEVLNQDLFYYWVNFLNTNNLNSFSFEVRVRQDMLHDCDELENAVNEVNKAIEKTKIQLPNTFFGYSQSHLNLLHKRWVELQQQMPTIKTFLALKDNTLVRTFDDINHIIHRIEHRLKFLCTTDPAPDNITNPFMSDIETMTNKVGHIFLSYKNLGRTCWQKYCVGDYTFADADTNNWETIGTDIVIDLNPMTEQQLPKEYVDLCTHFNRPAVGPELPLARFAIKDMSRLKTIIRGNILKATNGDNKFTFMA